MAISLDEVEDFDTVMTEQNIAANNDSVEWLICAPYPFLGFVNAVMRGAQDCSVHDKGAFTGEVSAAMLASMGCGYCIVGHSERRTMHHETDDMIREKAKQCLANGIKAIICVGETLEQREQGLAFDIVDRQIRNCLPDEADAFNSVIAYEPVWAIGTGHAATEDDVADMHLQIRRLLKTLLASGDQMRIIYGGSVKPSNAESLLHLDNVDGALIGGASLKAEDFIAIGQAAGN